MSNQTGSPTWKERVDGLEARRRAVSELRNKRRDFEWKVSLALWTALAAYLGALVGGKSPSGASSGLLVGLTCALLIVLVAGHVVWVVGVKVANDYELKQERAAESAMLDLLGLEQPAEGDGRKLLTKFYSAIFQITTTTVLAIAIMVTTLALPKAPPEQSKLVIATITADEVSRLKRVEQAIEALRSKTAGVANSDTTKVRANGVQPRTERVARSTKGRS